MIIFGTGKRLLHISDMKFDCASCGSMHSVRFDFYVYYFHIFWIPMFSYRTSVLSQCNHCRQVLLKREMPIDWSRHIALEKPSVPWKYYSGIFIALGLVLLIWMSIANEKRQTKKYLLHPKTGDVYGIKQPNGYYTLYLLSEQRGDSLGFRINNYEVKTSSNLSVIRRNHAHDYGDTLFFWSESELQGLLDERYILNIRRD